jgi:hypothetical protein
VPARVQRRELVVRQPKRQPERQAPRRELEARQPERGVRPQLVRRQVRVRRQLVPRQLELERPELGRLRQQPVGLVVPVGSGPPAERPVVPCGPGRAVRSGGC